MKQLLATSALAALLASPAFAEGVNYTRLSYDFTRYTNDDIDFDLDSNLLQGGVEYTLGQVLLSADIANQDFALGEDASGDEFDSSLLTYAFSAGYFLTPEVMIGGGLIGTSFESELRSIVTIEIEDDTTGFELFGQYVDPQFGLGVNVRNFDTDQDNVTSSFYGEFGATPELTLAAIITNQSEAEVTDYVISADYVTGPIDVRAFYSDSADDSIGIFGSRGYYEFTNQIRGAASFEVFTGDDLPDFYSVTVGAGYQVVDGLWADARFGILDGDDVEGDPSSVQFTLTYETGDRIRLDRRLEQDRIDDIQVSSVPTLDF